MIGHVRVAERPELDRGHAGQPGQFRYHRPQRVTAVQVVGAVGDHDHGPFPVQHPGQEGDQVPGGPVGPVQVLQDQQHRAGGGQLGEQAEHRPEQLLLGEPGCLTGCGWDGVAVGQQAAEHRPAGQRVGQRPGRGGAGHAVPQRIGQRQVRDTVAQLGAPPGEHQEAPVSGPRGQLSDQARLADPGVPADERVRRAARDGVVEQAKQAGQLTVPAHQPFARTAQHMFSITVRRAPGRGTLREYLANGRWRRHRECPADAGPSGGCAILSA